MKCEHCRTELPDNAKFCNRCGKSVEAESVCSRCQHGNPQGSSFCLQCGQPLVSVQEPSSVPSMPTSFANGRYQVKEFLGEG
jgi:predicted amidophosphoribosyltransferase